MVDPAADRPRAADRWLPLALILVGPVLLFGPMLARGEVLYWGTPLLQFVPWRTYAFELVRDGWLPLWNPLVGMGAPLLANYQSALLYPPNWILAFTQAGWGEGLLVLGHLVFAGVGTVLVLRRLHTSTLGQAVGGIAFASGTLLVARAGFFSFNAAASYLPWLVLCADIAAERARSRVSWRWLPAIAGLSVVVALQALAGHAQSMAYSLLLAAAWSLWRAADGGGWGAVGRVAGLWLVAGMIGLAIAGAQLFPTAEYLSQSSRGAGLDATVALTYSFWPWRTLGLLLPDLFGNPAVGDYWGYANYWEDALYIGVLPLLMALTAVVRAGRLGRQPGRIRTFLLIAAGLAFLLALGANTPVYPFLFRWVPVIGAFNAPTRFNLITVFCLALLAGLGAGLWSRPEGRTLYWTRLATAGAGAVLLLGIGAAVAPTGLRESFGRSFAWAGLWLLIAGVLALRWPSGVGRGWVALLALVVSLDLVIAGRGLNPTTGADLYHGASLLAQQTADGHRLFLFPEAERILKFERSHRFDSYQAASNPMAIRRSGLPNTPMLDRLPSANNFDPLLPARYVDWVAALGSVAPDEQSLRLRLMDVGWLAASIGQDPPWTSYAHVEGAQRARLIPSAVAAANEPEALRLLASEEVDLARVVIVETAAAEDPPAGGEGTATVLASPDPGRAVVEVEAPQGGWLLLSDTWFPGWSATIDGAPAETYPANVAFRAVWVPPGSSTVVWQYAPDSPRLGAILSIAGLLGLALLTVSWIALRRRV